VRIQRLATVSLLSLLAAVPGMRAERQEPAAPPQAPPPQVSMMEASPVLRAIDADHDRIITTAELDKAPAALAQLDKDGDGTLTRAEAGAPLPQRGGRGREGGREGGRAEPPQIPAPGPTAEELLSALLTLDKNNDGKLQKSEVSERQAGLFERGDTNTDNVLDGAELRKLTADQAAAPVAPPRAGRGRGGFGRFDPAAAALDKDANGAISAEEIAGAPAALKVLDKNNDGRITEDELVPSGEGRGAQE
jgi:Ca2+-binding EF-hand superfamily protein